MSESVKKLCSSCQSGLERAMKKLLVTAGDKA